MKILMLFLIVFLGYSCTAKKLAVENADTLLSHQIQKRLPLYTQQKAELDIDIIKFLNETKPTAQEIIPIVDELRLTSEPKVEEQYAQLEGFYKKIAKNFSVLMSKYMAKLDARQQKDFFRTLANENQDILNKSKKNRFSEIEDRFKLFMGSMSAEQKKILEGYKDYFSERASLRLKNRKNLHQEFKSIYAQDVTSTKKEELFQNAFTGYQDESLNTNKNLEIIKKLLPHITQKQRDHFQVQTQEVKELLKFYIQTDY